MYGEKAYYRFLDGESSTLIHDYSGNYNNAKWSGDGFFDREFMRCIKVDIEHRLLHGEERFGLFLSFEAPTDKFYLSDDSYLELQPYTVNSLYIDNLDGNFHAYLNGDEIEIGAVDVEEGKLLKLYDTGNDYLSLRQDYLFIDKMKVSKVLIFDSNPSSIQELFEELTTVHDSDIEYYIDGVNLKNYNVFVSGSQGLVSRLSTKERMSYDWQNRHGLAVAHTNIYYKPRTIKLECFIVANGRSSYVDQLNEFLAVFNCHFTSQLMVEYENDIKPLVYQVSLTNDVDPDKTWSHNQNGMMVGVFTLELVENEPVKRVLKHHGGYTSFIRFEAKDCFNIYWGDGEASELVGGNDIEKMITHTYKDGKQEHYIVMTGAVETINTFNTDCIEVWSDLH